MQRSRMRSVLVVLALLLGLGTPPTPGEPGPFASRGAGKAGALSKAGGNDKTEAAVLGALHWLARHQNEDGGWGAEAFARCGECEGTGDAAYDTGVAGLALLAFLGAGHSPLATDTYADPVTQKEMSLGGTVQRGLEWLLRNQAPDGGFGRGVAKQMYVHAIATAALAEAYGLTAEDKYRDAAQRAADFLVAARTPGAGWRYRPSGGESDSSATGWAVTALHAAKLAGLTVEPAASSDALAFITDVTNPVNGLVGYRQRAEAGIKVVVQGKNEDYQHHETLTAAAMVVRAFAAGDRGDPALDLGAKALVCDLPIWSAIKKSNDYYYWYYATLALHQFDGPGTKGRGLYWKSWNKAMTDAVVKNQEKGRCAAGSWSPDDRWSWEAGRVCATALMALTLESYYRYDCAFADSKKK